MRFGRMQEFFLRGHKTLVANDGAVEIFGAMLRVFQQPLRRIRTRLTRPLCPGVEGMSDNFDARLETSTSLY